MKLYGEAEFSFEKVLKIISEEFGEGHPQSIDCIKNLGSVYL